MFIVLWDYKRGGSYHKTFIFQVGLVGVYRIGGFFI